MACSHLLDLRQIKLRILNCSCVCLSACSAKKSLAHQLGIQLTAFATKHWSRFTTSSKCMLWSIHRFDDARPSLMQIAKGRPHTLRYIKSSAGNGRQKNPAGLVRGKLNMAIHHRCDIYIIALDPLSMWAKKHLDMQRIDFPAQGERALGILRRAWYT